MYRSSNRGAWIEVNLDNFLNNLQFIKSTIKKGTKIMCIVKSDGYRSGALELTQVAIDFGIEYFGVATLSEAISLRKHFKDIKILILGYTPNYLLDELCNYNIMPNIYTYNNASAFNEICKNKNKIGKIHLSVDTGMNRVGFVPSEKSLKEIIDISKLSNIKIDGIFSHFAVADTDEKFTYDQFNKFINFTKELETNGINLGLKHIANSASILKYRDYDLDMVRPGAIMHGIYRGFCIKKDLPLKKDVEIFAMIANVKIIKKGEGVSYGQNFIATKDTKVVTLPLGYGDFIPRIMSGKFYVLINGHKCPQIGNICMDQMMVDATGVECKIDDIAVIIGKDHDQIVEAFDFCNFSGDVELSYINHLSSRMPLVFIKNGKVILEKDFIRNL